MGMLLILITVYPMGEDFGPYSYSWG
jgi:hypothetical protein